MLSVDGGSSLASTLVGLRSVLTPLGTCAVGPLPHLDLVEAAEFSIERFSIPTLPTLPRRSPAESLILQALSGIHGVTPGQYGSVAIDVQRLSTSEPVTTEWTSDSFTGFRAVLDRLQAQRFGGVIKWQLLGPLSVGVALRRAGAGADLAFGVARRAVRQHLIEIAAMVTSAVPTATQVIVTEEPFAKDLNDRDFPVTPSEAMDMMSEAMAAVQDVGVVGVRGGDGSDMRVLIEAGPHLVFVDPTQLGVFAGQVARHVSVGGWVAWGVVATNGPIDVSSARSRLTLADAWSAMRDHGIDLDQLVEQSLLGPSGGLDFMDVAVAERVVDHLRSVAVAARSDNPLWTLSRSH